MRVSLLLALGGGLAACAAMIESPAPLAELEPSPDRRAEIERIDAAMTEATRAARAASERALAPNVVAPTAPVAARVRPLPATPATLTAR